VNAIFPGAEQGEENDLNPVAVSYCLFGSKAPGSVSVGVAKLGDTASATARVRAMYNSMAAEGGQSIHTFTVGGEFGFTIGSATALKGGETLYALNAQGSRGRWYVAIQYYAHKPCTSSAMQHLLSTVLSNVPWLRNTRLEDEPAHRAIHEDRFASGGNHAGDSIVDANVGEAVTDAEDEQQEVRDDRGHVDHELATHWGVGSEVEGPVQQIAQCEGAGVSGREADGDWPGQARVKRHE
jgi:hypothetical protein